MYAIRKARLRRHRCRRTAQAHGSSAAPLPGDTPEAGGRSVGLSHRHAVGTSLWRSSRSNPFLPQTISAMFMDIHHLCLSRTGIRIFVIFVPNSLSIIWRSFGRPFAYHLTRNRRESW